MTRLVSLILTLTICPLVLGQEPGTAPSGDGAMLPTVKMETTLGDFVLELDAAKAPITVQNFLKYCDEGFFEGTIFHRVMKGFMLQAGGFDAEMNRKTAGVHEPIMLEASNGLSNVKGTVAMARSGNPNSATCQFFINAVDNTKKLDPKKGSPGYTVFGKVVEGMDTVEKIRNTEVQVHAKYKTRDGAVTPIEPVVITKVTVTRDIDRSKLAASCDAAVDRVQKVVAQAESAKEQGLQDYINKTEKELGKQFTKDDSGIMSVILQEGQGGDRPAATDTVEVHYTGWLVDGTKFDSSVDRGAPATFPLNRVIKGWTLGVGQMTVGEKRRLIIPADLGYGKRGSPPVIPPDATLVFDVELLSIK